MDTADAVRSCAVVDGAFLAIDEGGMQMTARVEQDRGAGDRRGERARRLSWNERRRARRARARTLVKDLPAVQLGWLALGAGVLGLLVPLAAPVAWWAGRRARRGPLAGTSRASRIAAAWGQVLGAVVTCVMGVAASRWLVMSLVAL
jgi:hypothetical protein